MELTEQEIEKGVIGYEQATGRIFIPTRVPEQEAFFRGMEFMKYLQSEHQSGGNEASEGAQGMRETQGAE